MDRDLSGNLIYAACVAQSHAVIEPVKHLVHLTSAFRLSLRLCAFARAGFVFSFGFHVSSSTTLPSGPSAQILSGWLPRISTPPGSRLEPSGQKSKRYRRTSSRP